jgi:antitoxin component of MazEF toxin-antitoxin module
VEGVQQLRLRDGDPVSFEFGRDAITIRRAKPRRKWTEAELLKGVTPGICGPDLIPDRLGKELL